MPKRLVDVYDKSGKLLHTYPIELGGLNYEPSEKEFIDHAIKAAIEDDLVPADQVKTLKTKVRLG